MSVKHLDSANFSSFIGETKTPIIIDFWASWCGPCQMMGPVFEELSGEYDGKLAFAKVSTEEAPEIAGQFSVRSIPTLVIVKDGREVERIVGFGPKPVLKEKIDSVLERI